MDSRMLNIVDEQGNILGERTRQEIHEKGLLHRIVHVWFYTPDGKLIFQHRAKDKDTAPDLLDATVAGHVEIGSTFEEAAILETKEETGLELTLNDLDFIEKIIVSTFDEETGTRPHHLCNTYAYRFKGKLSDLQIEEGKAIGFEEWPIESLFNLSEVDATRFIPTILDKNGLATLKRIQALL